MSGTNADNMTSLGGSAYSFYLNVVVLEHLPPPSSPMPSSTPSLVEEEKAPETPTKTQDDEQPETPSTEQKRKPRILSDLDKSLHNFGKAVSKRTSSAKNIGAAYMASMTMVSRALSALTKSLQDLAASCEELELTIGKRFHQGRVIVLHVDLKAAAMPRYIEETNGADAAMHYRSAMSTLALLEATETMGTLEREMLPQVRQGLMKKLSDLLMSTMKEKDNLLEVECIALEEAEEARWLFTFMEFQEQMK